MISLPESRKWWASFFLVREKTMGKKVVTERHTKNNIKQKNIYDYSPFNGDR